MTEPLNSGNISTRLERIAELAKKHPERSFRSVHHSIDLEWLAEAARRGRKDGAAGVDGQTWAEYEENLEDNLDPLVKTPFFKNPSCWSGRESSGSPA